MNHLEAPPSRRSRWRNVVAVSVMWAGLATFAVTDTATAADARPTVDSGDSRAAATASAAQGDQPPHSGARSRARRGVGRHSS